MGHYMDWVDKNKDWIAYGKSIRQEDSLDHPILYGFTPKQEYYDVATKAIKKERNIVAPDFADRINHDAIKIAHSSTEDDLSLYATANTTIRSVGFGRFDGKSRIMGSVKKDPTLILLLHPTRWVYDLFVDKYYIGGEKSQVDFGGYPHYVFDPWYIFNPTAWIIDQIRDWRDSAIKCGYAADVANLKAIRMVNMWKTSKVPHWLYGKYFNALLKKVPSMINYMIAEHFGMDMPMYYKLDSHKVVLERVVIKHGGKPLPTV
jgi:hypothetical protein